LLGKFGDKTSPIRKGRDETFKFELAECLADRCAAYCQLFRERCLGQMLTRGEVAANDRVAYEIDYLVFHRAGLDFVE